ncbi:hypothetical protein J7337_010017 [Fusarium musae]|uniref:Uncharacterized protein n=1 Tax=Fusarium musae TaxID=1042133 RepID=A0A9P8DC66_9HYPO|nr:hypothetical protein J7337_010017 [Fusarium musae]KAG9499198.1 hypothetical protein J7337_010017 [Fusarium musae]
MATKSSRRTYTLPAGLKTVAISVKSQAENHKSTGHSKWHQGERNTKVEKENKVAKAHVQAKASGRDKSSTGEAKESDEDPDFVTPEVYVQYLENFFLFRGNREADANEISRSAPDEKKEASK